MTDFAAITLFCIGAFQGAAVFPVMRLAQFIARFVSAKRPWIQLGLALALWVLAMVGIAQIANGFIEPSVRQQLSMFWVGGFLFGMIGGSLIRLPTSRLPSDDSR
jgi:hypothetical protein